MRTFAQHRAHMKRVTGEDVAAHENEWYRFKETGGWVHQDVLIEDNDVIQIGENAAVYGKDTYLSDKTVLADDAVVGPGIRTLGSTYIGGSAHVTGEMPGHPPADDFYVLNDANITGENTWICRSNLIGTIVANGAWLVKSEAGSGYVADPETVLIECDLGECRPADIQLMDEDPDLPPEGAQAAEPVYFAITHGARLTRCNVLPGVTIDLPVELSDRHISESDPAFTTKASLLQAGLEYKFDLEEEESPLRGIDFTASREQSRGKTPEERKSKPQHYKM